MLVKLKATDDGRWRALYPLKRRCVEGVKLQLRAQRRVEGETVTSLTPA